MILEHDVAIELMKVKSLEREVEQLRKLNVAMLEELGKAYRQRDEIMIEHLCLLQARCKGCPHGVH